MTHQQRWWTSTCQPGDTSERPTSRRAAHKPGFHMYTGGLMTKRRFIYLKQQQPENNNFVLIVEFCQKVCSRKHFLCIKSVLMSSNNRDIQTCISMSSVLRALLLKIMSAIRIRDNAFLYFVITLGTSINNRAKDKKATNNNLKKTIGLHAQ